VHDVGGYTGIVPAAQLEHVTEEVAPATVEYAPTHATHHGDALEAA